MRPRDFFAKSTLSLPFGRDPESPRPRLRTMRPCRGAARRLLRTTISTGSRCVVFTRRHSGARGHPQKCETPPEAGFRQSGSTYLPPGRTSREAGVHQAGFCAPKQYRVPASASQAGTAEPMFWRTSWRPPVAYFADFHRFLGPIRFIDNALRMPIIGGCESGRPSMSPKMLMRPRCYPLAAM